MKIVYVRFGDIPRNGKSYNSLEEKYEVGVSVYEALYYQGGYKILLPSFNETAINTLGMCYNSAQCLSGQLNISNRINLVEGVPIGIGSDGEILLKNCKIIKPIFEKEINTWREIQ